MIVAAAGRKPVALRSLGASCMKSLNLAGAWLLATTGFAQAADMPVKAPPPPEPVLSWTGFYIGGNVGYAWGNSTTSSPLANDPGCIPCYQASVVRDINNQSAQTQSARSVIGGVEAGYNLQLGQVVLGAEADAGFYR